MHRDIPDHKPAFEAMKEILETGNTQQLATRPSISRGIEAITFIELYEDVVVSAQHSLLKIAELPEFKGIVEVESHVLTGDGGLRRVSFHEDPDWWQRLRIESLRDGSMKITALTSGGARVDIRTQPIQRQSVEPFLKAMMNTYGLERDMQNIDKLVSKLQSHTE
ncbi:MAG: hypothetical protein U9P11_07060 [Pseudomonadota bacterium]|nr:hypothetical protein [Pseudomonadota bacterium]